MATWDCIVPGCPRAGRHSVNLRIMRPDTSAIVAPRTGAYLCDDHATMGLDVELRMVPTLTKAIHVETWAVGPDGEDGDVVVKELPIKGKAKRTPT